MITLLYSYEENGPGKVVKNLKLGLEELGVLYKENTTIDKGDKVIALQYTDLILTATPENILIGPNVCTLPIDNSFLMSQRYKKTLVPCDWVKNKYKKWISEDKIFIWPVGIDTNLFSDFSCNEKEYDCLIYFKRRHVEDLHFVTKILKEKNKTFNILEYGKYNENTFVELLKKTKYAFIIDGTESQGIAIQEMMSSNLPLFVWDVDTWDDRGLDYSTSATSIPYWDDRCGVSELEKENVKEKFQFFLNNIDTFKPRDFVLENLTTKKQAKKLIDLLN